MFKINKCRIKLKGVNTRVRTHELRTRIGVYSISYNATTMRNTFVNSLNISSCSFLKKCSLAFILLDKIPTKCVHFIEIISELIFDSVLFRKLSASSSTGRIFCVHLQHTKIYLHFR